MPHASTSSTLQVGDHAQCQPEPIRIIHVGMGASGLLAAYKARKMLNNYELVCYEKNASIGGTWFVNRYPGCACDIPAHTYTFPWDPNPDWSQFYAGSEEIQRYFEGFLHKHLLEPFVRLNTEVLHAEWREYEGLWNVTLRNTGSGKEMWTDTCNVLINGSGVLSKWQWPAIEGLFDFKGVLAHSAVWPQNLDWSGKKVAVIGTGSSSIQMVPKLAQTSERLTVFMRSNTYIGAPWGTQVTNTEADPEALDPVAEGMHRYTEKEKRRFREDPDYFLRYRTSIEREIANRGWDMYNRGTELNISVKKATQNSMRSRLGNRDDLKQRIIPDWSPGCRRLTPGEGYLEALTEPNVHCEFDAIEKITSRGLVTKAGTQHDVDIIACATGFYVQYQPHFKIVGKNGEVMQNIAEPNVYASVAAPGFPNYFVINGPRGNWGQGCALPSHEVQMEYVLQCCRKMQEDRIKCMEPKQSVTRQMNEYMDAWHAKSSVWAEDCKSWYKANTKEGTVYIWPGSLLHHLKFMKRPRYEHYNITYANPNNMFDFLGNGRTICQVKYGANAPVPYIRDARSEDVPWDIE